MVGDISLVYNYYLFNNAHCMCTWCFFKFLCSDAWWLFVEPKHLVLDDKLFCLTVVLHLYSIQEMSNRLCNKKMDTWCSKQFVFCHRLTTIERTLHAQTVWLHAELSPLPDLIMEATGLFWHWYPTTGLHSIITI